MSVFIICFCLTTTVVLVGRWNEFVLNSLEFLAIFNKVENINNTWEQTLDKHHLEKMLENCL